MKHAKYSPSSSSRWTKCPSSLQYAPSEEETEASIEGTTAHMLNDLCWSKDIDPLDCLGLHLNNRVVDEDMANGSDMWMQEVSRYVRMFPGCEVKTEQRLGEGEFFGTADMIIDALDSLIILDYKYGHTPVEAVNNTQLLCYATLWLLQNPDRDPEITLVIVQPRNGGVKSWSVTAQEVMEFYDKQVEPVILQQKGGYCSGDHCNFCPGMLQCPELHQLATSPEEFMTPEKAADVLSRAKVLKKYLDKVEEYAHQELEAGREVPGFKLVDKRAARTWSAGEDEILKAARRAGVKKSEMFRKVMLTPAQAEPMLGPDLIRPLVKCESSGTTVVPINDKRSGLDLESIRREFQ
jgi:Protein of unknown function (DUF2800)